MTFFLKEGGKNRDLKPWFLDRCGSGTYQKAYSFFLWDYPCVPSPYFLHEKQTMPQQQEKNFFLARMYGL